MSSNETRGAKKKSTLEDTLLLNVVQQYFKYAALVLLIWVVGYFAFSPSWLLLGLVVFVWKERHNKAQRNQIAIAQQLAKGEKEVILARVEDLPSWVYFPDVERAEWVNKMIDQLWPYIGDYVTKLLIDTIEPKVQASHSMMASFKFKEIDLGDIPPRIGGVKVYTENVRRDEIYMDLEIVYSSDSNVSVSIKGINAGIKDLQLHGTMRVIFRPLISKIPLVGGLSVFFLNNPSVDFNLTSAANALDLPGLNDMLKTIVQEQIAGIMVLPNRIPISMTEGLDLNKLRYPQPQGVLRIQVLEAKDLVKADLGVLGKGKSDPYAKIYVGAQKFETKVIDNSVNPVWNQSFEAVVDEAEGQFMQVEVNDKDPNKDDRLGSVNIDIAQVFDKKLVDQWLQLEEVKKGLVHVRLTWLHLANDPLELDRVESEQLQDSEDGLSACLLLVNLDSARGLPRGKKTLSEPSPYVYMTVGQKKEESVVKYNTNEPRWEQNFRFLVQNPRFQNLELEVREKKNGKNIGDATIRLRELLSAPDMVLDQRFQLAHSDPNAQIYMRLTLRILTTREYQRPTETLIKEVPEENTDGTDAEKTPASGGTSTAKSDGTSVDGPQAPPASKDSNAAENNNAAIPEEIITPVTSKGTEVRQRKPQSVNPAGKYGRGRIQMTFRYSSQRRQLVVVIHKCVSLLPCDSDKLADPYVRLYLLPERSSSNKRKTQIVKNNVNPVYDETFEYPVGQSELANRSLEIAVKNDKSFWANERTLLGVVHLDLANLDISKAVTEWFDLQSEESISKVSLESDV